MSGPQGPSIYQLQGEPTADKGAMAGISSVASAPNAGASAISGLGASLAALGGNSGYSPGQTVNYGNAESNMGFSLAPWATSVMNTAADPQNALYARTLQQTQDQVRAAESARGIAMSPYGAGIENEATNNFNIDWQNNMLGRQLQGLQGAGQALQTGGGLVSQGQQTAQSAPGSQVDWFSKYAQVSPAAYAQPQQLVADYLQYLDTGTNASLAKLKGFSAQNSSDSGFFGGIGQGIGAIGSLL